MLFGRLFKAALGLIRSSLQIRALVYTVALAGSALILLGGVLSVSIGNGLFNTRTEHALEESERAKNALPRILKDVVSDSTWSINEGIKLAISELESSGVTQSRHVALLNFSKQPNADRLDKPTSSNIRKLG